jgi:hypothetical protein
MIQQLTQHTTTPSRAVGKWFFWNDFKKCIKSRHDNSWEFKALAALDKVKILFLQFWELNSGLHA